MDVGSYIAMPTCSRLTLKKRMRDERAASSGGFQPFKSFKRFKPLKTRVTDHDHGAPRL